jgi:hypothetical protein
LMNMQHRINIIRFILNITYDFDPGMEGLLVDLKRSL